VSIYDRARDSFRHIMKTRLRLIDFVDRVTGEVVFSATGQVTRIDASIDPQTNLQVRTPSLAVTVSVLDLPRNPDRSLEEGMETKYFIRTADTLGQELVVQIIDKPRIDYTIGFANFIGRSVEVTVDEPEEP
jgi:hypothetical protein